MFAKYKIERIILQKDEKGVIHFVSISYPDKKTKESIKRKVINWGPGLFPVDTKDKLYPP